MRLTFALAIAAGLCALTPALAEDALCKQPQSSWKPVDELKAKLTAEGWTISNVKTDEGCYEVYAKDQTGAKVEVYFDPVTFTKVSKGD